MKKVIILTIVAVAMLLISCNNYEKILKGTDNETKYKMGMDFYKAGKYRKAIAFLEPTLMYVRGTERDDSTNFTFAKAYYLNKDPYTAEYYFEMFGKTFPRSKFAEEASFLYAMCLYNESHRPELDQTPTQRCIIAFTEYLFNNKNAPKEREEKARSVISELKQRLIYKSFESAKLYYTIEDYRSAIVSLKNHIKEFPESMYREEALFLALKSSYVYATHSKPEKRRERLQNTIDEYLNLTSEYPVSKYKKEAQDMYDYAVKATQYQAEQQKADDSTPIKVPVSEKKSKG